MNLKYNKLIWKSFDLVFLELLLSSKSTRTLNTGCSGALDQYYHCILQQSQASLGSNLQLPRI